MGFRLILIMAMGLGALYMMHLLAQDYDRIRQPVAAATRALTSASSTLIQLRQLRGKRNVAYAEQLVNNTTTDDASNSTDHIIQQQIIVTSPPKIDWKRILSRDPFECLLSLICQLMSGAESNSYESVMLMDYLETTLSIAPAKISRAFSLGLSFRGNTDRCYDEYPFCMYSANTMMRVLKWFSVTEYDD